MSEESAPVGWSKRILLALADYHNGVAFKPDDWGSEGLPIIRIEQINGSSAPKDFYAGSLPRQNAIDDGDLIFSWSATLKAVIWKGGPGVLNQHLFKVVPKDGNDLAFVKHLLDGNMERISSAAQGSTMKHVTRRELGRYHVSIPERKAEQRRIAEILSTLDETIEQTEALIAKYQQIKAGLMHDLFTRGVTLDGHLRPSYAEAPQLYKESPLGWIPRDWSVGPLSQFLLGGPKNGYSPQEANEWSGLFSLGLGCLTTEGFRPNHLKFVTNSSTARKSALLADGDLLVSRSNTRDLVGLCGIYRDVGSSCIYPDLMMRIRPNEKTSAPFLEALLLSPLMRRKITGLAAGTSGSMVKLNARAILRLELAIPSEHEQLQILKVMNVQTSQIELLKSEFAKLRRKKAGLMHDLLTGSVRVPFPSTPRAKTANGN